MAIIQEALTLGQAGRHVEHPALRQGFGLLAVDGDPIHDGWEAHYTGTRMMDGVMVSVYHCPFGMIGSTPGNDFVVRCP
jgi:hypothetical protein